MASQAVPMAAVENQTQPAFGQMYNTREAREVIAKVLRTKLHGKAYHPDIAPVWTREIADEIKHQLKEKKYPRYKYAVQVVIGEQKGEGVKMGCRCFWDSNTDDYAEETFSNETLFCVAVAFAAYVY